ncbi:MAG: DMT family transporter [Acidobacteriota bacterium]
MSRLPAVILLAAVAAVWGATFPVVKGALADAGPLTFLALRFGLATVCLLPWLRSRGSSGVGVARAVLCGVALFGGYAFQTWGLQATTPARSAFITAISVVLVPLLEPLVGIGRPCRRVWIGALMAFGGLAVLLRPESRPISIGDVLTLGCALAFAAHVLLLQWAARVLPATRLSAVQIVASTALAVPAAGVEGWRFSATPRLAVAVVVCALLATVFAFWAMTAVQRVLSAGLTAVVLAFEPAAAALVSVAIGQDALGGALVAGGALVIAGVVVATIEPRGAPNVA